MKCVLICKDYESKKQKGDDFMNMKEFKSTLVLCIVALIIGAFAKGLGWLNAFVNGMGFFLLLLSFIGIVVLITLWHWDVDNLKKSNILSVKCLLGGIVGVLLGSWCKLTFVSVICGLFAVYSTITLIIGVFFSIMEYVDDVMNKDVSDDKEEKERIKIE